MNKTLIQASVDAMAADMEEPRKRKTEKPNCLLGDITHEITKETDRWTDADYGKLMRYLMRYDINHFESDESIEPKPDDGIVWANWPSFKAKIDRIKATSRARSNAVGNREDRR